MELSTLTHLDVKSRINGLLDKRNHLWVESKQIETELDRHRACLQKDMPRLKKLLGIDSVNGETVSLSCPAITTAISKMQSGVRDVCRLSIMKMPLPPETTEEQIKVMLLSRTQAGPGITVKQEQEEISRNHVQTFIYLFVDVTIWN